MSVRRVALLPVVVLFVSSVVCVHETYASIQINEFHYQNTGTDMGEFVEIAGPAGTDLSGWEIQLYEHDGGALVTGSLYSTPLMLSGSIDDEGGGFGAVAFPKLGIVDTIGGFALVDPFNTVIQFLSYGGPSAFTLTAVDGAAMGQVSTNVGVSESGSTQAGKSIQLKGTGSEIGDFNWLSGTPDSPGSINTDQTYIPEPASLLAWGGLAVFGFVVLRRRSR